MERQKLKQEALSLRHDYGLSVPKIMRQLNLKRPTLYRYLSHNSHSGLSHNFSNIQHLEGDCLEILPTIWGRTKRLSTIGWSVITAISRTLVHEAKKLAGAKVTSKVTNY